MCAVLSLVLFFRNYYINEILLITVYIILIGWIFKKKIYKKSILKNDANYQI